MTTPAERAWNGPMLDGYSSPTTDAPSTQTVPAADLSLTVPKEYSLSGRVYGVSPGSSGPLLVACDEPSSFQLVYPGTTIGAGVAFRRLWLKLPAGGSGTFYVETSWSRAFSYR